MDREYPTARLICDILSGGKTRGPYPKDPRGIAKKAEKYVKEQGYDISYWGPEVEFFVFDKLAVNTLTPSHGQSYEITSREAPWSTDNVGYALRLKEGYLPSAPGDTLMLLPCALSCSLTIASSNCRRSAVRTPISTRMSPSGLCFIEHPGVHRLDQGIAADEVHLHGKDAKQEVSVGGHVGPAGDASTQGEIGVYSPVCRASVRCLSKLRDASLQLATTIDSPDREFVGMRSEIKATQITWHEGSVTRRGARQAAQAEGLHALVHRTVRVRQEHPGRRRRAGAHSARPRDLRPRRRQRPFRSERRAEDSDGDRGTTPRRRPSGSDLASQLTIARKTSAESARSPSSSPTPDSSR